MQNSILYFLFLLLFIHCSVYGQNPLIEWQKCFGGSNDDYAYSIKQTSDKGFILCGRTHSQDGDVTGNLNANVWVLKVDSNGIINWQQCIGGNGFDNAFEVLQTADGNYIVAGSTSLNSGDCSNLGNITGFHGCGGASSSDYLVAKLDSTGSPLWKKAYGGYLEEIATSIEQTVDGGYIIAGYTKTSGGNNGDVTNAYSGWSADYWIVKIDGDGVLQWQKILGGTSEDIPYSIKTTTDNGYIVVGSSSSNDGDITGNKGNEDYWVAKLDHTGNLQWQKALGGSETDIAYSVLQTEDDGYIIVGETSSANGDILGYHGNGYSDSWIVKLDSVGNLQWQKTLGGTNKEKATSICKLANGKYLVSGISSSNNGDVTTNIGNDGYIEYWLVLLNNTGGIEWQSCLNGVANADNAGPGFTTNLYYAAPVYPTIDGGFAFAGSYRPLYGNLAPGYHNGTAHYTDYWLAKLGPDFMLGIDKPEQPSPTITLYPNPFTDIINISPNFNYSLYDLMGKEVDKNNLLSLPSGTYILKCGLEVTKVVKK